MTEATPTETEGAAGEQASTAAESSSFSESDFKERARNDPEFAWNQVRQFQSKYDKAASAEEKYQQLVELIGEPTMNLIKQYGGNVVGTATNNYAALRSDPTIGEMIQEFERTGQLPQRTGSKPNMDNEDEYKTPEEREIEALKAQVARLEQNVGTQVMTSGQRAIKDHMEQVSREYDFPDDVFDRMKESVVSTINTWSKAGDVGQRALQSLASENGYNQIKGLMLQVVTPDDLRAAAERAALRKQGKLRDIATDVPGRVSSAGKEAPPDFGRNWAEAAKWARNNPEGHDSR